MAALGHKILLPLLISIALFLSAEAQYSYDDEDGNAATSGSSVSYISATPDASPAGAPGYTVSYVSSAPDASPTTAAPVSAVSYISSTQEASPAADPSASDSSSSSATMVTLDTQPMSYEVPAAERVGVNMFVQSTMVASVTKTDNFIENVIEKRLSDPQIDSYTRDCLQTCKEVYEDSVSAMKKTLADIKEGNYFKANVDVSAMSVDADTCKECVKQVFGEDPEFDKFSKWVDGVIDECLSKITGASS